MGTREEAVLALVTDFRNALQDFDTLHKRYAGTIDKINTSTDQAEIDGLEVQARALADELERAGRDGQAALRKLIAGGELTEEELREATAQAAKLDRELAEVGRRGKQNLDKLGGSVEGLRRGLAAAGALVGALGLAAAARKVVAVSSEFERLRAVLETFEGGRAGAEVAFERILAFAKETPFQVDALTTAWTRLRAVGIEPTEELLRDLGNIAASSGEDILSVTEALNDAVTGEFERLKQFGIQARSEGDQVAFTYSGVTTTVEKSADAIQGYLQELAQARFGGAMARQAETTGGAFSNLEDAAAQLADRVGKGGLAPAVADAARQLTELATGSGDAADNLGRTLGQGVTLAVDSLAFLIEHLDAVKALLAGLVTAKATSLLLDYSAAALAAGRNVRALADAQKLLAGSTAATTAATGKLLGPVAIFVGALAALTVNTLEQSKRQAQNSEEVRKYREAVDAANQVLERGNTLSEEAARKKMAEALAVRQATRAKIEEAEAELAALQRQLDSFDPIATGLGGNPQRLAEQRELAVTIHALREVIDQQRATLERANAEWAAAGAALQGMAEAAGGEGGAAGALADLDAVLEKVGATTPASIQAAAAALTAYRDAVVSGGTATREQAELIVSKVAAIREAIALLPAEQRAGLGELSTELAGVEAKFAGLLKSLDTAAASSKATGEATAALGADAATAAGDVGKLADQLERVGSGVDPDAAKRVEDLEQSIAGLTERERELTSQPLDASGLVELQQVQDELAAAQFELREATDAVAASTVAASEAVEHHGDTLEETVLQVQEWVRAEHDAGNVSRELAESVGALADEQDRVTLATERAPAALSELSREIDRTGIEVRDLTGAQVDQLETQGDLSQSLADIKGRLDLTAGAHTQVADVAQDSTEAQLEGLDKLSEEQRQQVEGWRLVAKVAETEGRKIVAVQRQVIDGWKEMNRLCEEHRKCLTGE